MIGRAMAPAAAALVITTERADALRQSRFGGTGLTEDDRHRLIETEFEIARLEER